MVELENRELRKDNQLEEALFEATQAKKLEAEAVAALKELQIGLQANLNKDAVSFLIGSICSCMTYFIDSMTKKNILLLFSGNKVEKIRSLKYKIHQYVLDFLRFCARGNGERSCISEG